MFPLMSDLTGLKAVGPSTSIIKKERYKKDFENSVLHEIYDTNQRKGLFHQQPIGMGRLGCLRLLL